MMHAIVVGSSGAIAMNLTVCQKQVEKQRRQKVHPRDSVVRLYLSRKQGLISVEYCIDLAIIRLDHYIADSEERLLAAAKDDCEGVMEKSNQFKKKKKGIRGLLNNGLSSCTAKF